MKKVLLALFILILLGGCGLGGWYYITNQSAQKGLNLKLRATGEYILEWNPIIAENEKSNYMWGRANEQEFIQVFATEMSAGDMINNTLEIKDDFTAKLYTDGSNQHHSLYYMLAKNRTRILFFEDENCTERFVSKNALTRGIIIQDGKYLQRHFTEYEDETVVFTFFVVYEQVK